MVSLLETPPQSADNGHTGMNYEKQSSLTSSQAFANHAASPKAYSKLSVLPQASGSPHNNGLETPRKRRVPGSGDGVGYTEASVATPVKSLLSSNITPRSGARKIRAESASPTPNATPDGTPRFPRPRSSIEKGQTAKEDLRNDNMPVHKSPMLSKHSRSGSMTSDGPGPSLNSRPPLERNTSNNSAPKFDDTAKFFHANDIQAKKASRPTSMSSTPKAWAMGYSNSKTAENAISGRSSAMSNNSPTLDEQKAKFFYADEASEARSPPLTNMNSPISSRPILQTIYSEHTAAAISPVRPPSPLKEEVLPRKSSVTKASPRRHTRLVSSGGTEMKSPDSFAYNNSNISRRSSVKSASNSRTTAHVRSSSTHSSGPSPSRALNIAIHDSSLVEGTGASSTQIVSSPESTDLPTTTAEYATFPLRSQPQSPTKTQSRLDQMNELAANARRERKVLDLEISNSSLLAINQTLEREMRKQKAELRRYRRLSRTGRLSMPSSRSVSGTMSIFSGTDDTTGGEEGLSPSDSDSDPDQDDLDDISDLSTSPSSRPSSPTNRSARTRFKDLKHMPLDLSAQRNMLLESQKLNQSIKRCLGQSESLLVFGKRALEYQERSPDVENLGPKVLTPDEAEDDTIDRRQGLLSPVVLKNANDSNPWERSLGRVASLDSGLETPDFSNWGPSADQAPDKQLGGHYTGHASGRDYGKQKDLDGGAVAKDVENVLDKASKDSILPTSESSPVSPSPPPLETAAEPVPGSPLVQQEPLQLQPGPEDEPSEMNEVLDNDHSPKKALPKSSDSTNEYANTPGNRSSLKNLGSYLQSFSIFANGGLRPP